jgi:hypothetical protein
MKSSTKQALTDLVILTSLVNLALIRVWRELIFLGPADRYWANEVTARAIGAVLLNLVAVSLTLWLAALLVRRGGRRLDTLGRLGFVGLFLIPINYLRSLLGIGSEALYWLVSRPWLGVFIAAISGLLVVYVLVRHLVLLSRAAAVVALALSPFVLMTTVQAGLALYRVDSGARPPVTSVPDQHAATSSTGKQRVLWIMFDEFDSRLGFAERPEFVALPHLDQLRQQALFASATDAHRKNTTESIPSYLTGRLVETATARGLDDLGLLFEDDPDSGLHSWAEQPGFFSRAHDGGARVGVIGMYHPYCRIFASSLESCDQFSLSTYSPHPRAHLLAEMLVQLRALTPLASRLNGIDTYNGILQESMTMASDPRLDVVFVHASVPHGPEIFDLDKQAFSLWMHDGAAYFGNLVLADYFFGDVRASLQEAGLWDSTAVLVTSDHEWRRSENYDGIRTSQVPFLLKLPGQSDGLVYERRFSPMLVTGELLLEISVGRVSTPAGAVEWLDAHTPET